MIASSLKTRFRAPEATARHLGPTPRGRLKFGRMLGCRTRTAWNRRVKDVRRSVAGPLRTAYARYLPIGDSDFGAVKAQFIEMATYNRSQTCYSSEFPPRIYSQATGVKSLCNKPRFFGFHTGKPENTTIRKPSHLYGQHFPAIRWDSARS